MAKTAFILGAGASAEVKLPLGDKLTDDVRALLNIQYDEFGRRSSGDATITAALEQYATLQAQDIREYIHAARRISVAMPLAASIDNFLDAHRADGRISLCGKLAIVTSILRAERSSPMYRDHRRPDIPFNLDGVRETWFTLFWRLLSEGCTVEELHARLQSVFFVVFNYDRCIEHFLHNAVQLYYGVDEARATELLKGLRFFHPYGSVGPLPWQPAENRPLVGFGGEVNFAGLLSLAEGIKTFSESTADDEIRPTRDALGAADRLVFLGFAYHRQNLRLLWPNPAAHGSFEKRFYGTADGISDSDVEILRAEIAARTGIEHMTGGGKLPQIKCARLFHEYKQSLSLL